MVNLLHTLRKLVMCLAFSLFFFKLGGVVGLSFQNFCKKRASDFSHKKGGIGEIGGLFYCI